MGPYLLSASDRDGNHEGARRITAGMVDCGVVSLPALDHRGVNSNSELVLSHVLPFLRRVESGE